MKKLICAVLIAAAVGGAAKAADLPTAKPAEAEPSKPSCFSSLWDYLKSMISQSSPIFCGVAEAGFNPYTLRLANGPQSLANNNLFTPANQTTHESSGE